MKTEFEATFSNINKEKMRKLLDTNGGVLVKKEFLQKRCVFHLPKGHEISGGWLRVRDEQDKITLSLKIVQNNKTIEDQKEVELKIDDFNNACELLEAIGCTKKAYQESLREKWNLSGVEITIDEWPYLEPYVEVEGNSEESVKEVSKKLGFDYSTAYFGSVDGMYAKKYGITEDRIDNKTPEILFNMSKNPFLD
jgi:adenylate cyclase, class 2